MVLGSALRSLQEDDETLAPTLSPTTSSRGLNDGTLFTTTGQYYALIAAPFAALLLWYLKLKYDRATEARSRMHLNTKELDKQMPLDQLYMEDDEFEDFVTKFAATTVTPGGDKDSSPDAVGASGKVEEMDEEEDFDEEDDEDFRATPAVRPKSDQRPPYSTAEESRPDSEKEAGES
mmetsp:Transcript_2429/g.4688  ORF Transcript_2429/g.4688 Transcript_2429/m.4688 type:complete len:177 (-) Transcript_2429:2153-2683(-)